MARGQITDMDIVANACAVVRDDRGSVRVMSCVIVKNTVKIEKWKTHKAAVIFSGGITNL